MIKYNETQTGPKTEPGGVKNGFSKFTYQLDTDVLVKKEPTIPAV